MSRSSILAAALIALCGCDSQPTPTPGAEPLPSAVGSSAPAASSTAPAESASAATSAAGAPSQAASASGAASSTAAPSAEAQARETGCAPGAYRHSSPRFCLLAPEGYVPAKVKSGGVIAALLFRSQAPGAMDLEVSWAEQPHSVYLKERKDHKEAAKADADAVIGKTRNGRGLYVRYRHQHGGGEIAVGKSVVYSKGTIIWCKAQAFTKPKPPEDFLTACQTLVAR